MHFTSALSASIALLAASSSIVHAAPLIARTPSNARVCSWVNTDVKFLRVIPLAHVDACLCSDTFDLWLATQTELSAKTRVFLGPTYLRTYLQGQLAISAKNSHQCWQPHGFTCVPCGPPHSQTDLDLAVDADVDLAVDADLDLNAEITDSTLNTDLNASVDVDTDATLKIDDHTLETTIDAEVNADADVEAELDDLTVEAAVDADVDLESTLNIDDDLNAQIDASLDTKTNLNLGHEDGLQLDTNLDTKVDANTNIGSTNVDAKVEAGARLRLGGWGR